ncbi:MAG TPA: ABC transporter permease [Steroidobacteraceae bacterium]|nr:ABC transporter permease [Steroidobacteraceae bacterium]
MIEDLWTVFWKEWKETPFQRGGRRGGLVGVFIFTGVIGILLPAQAGRGWLDSPLVLLLSCWEPLFLVTSVIADAFAGERERHTLETLLASRLPDRAILFGKIAAGLAYGWGLMLLALLLGMVTVSLSQGHGQILPYTGEIGIGAAVLSFLAAWLAAGAGVLISLRAPTVRQAQQTLSLGAMVLTFLPLFGVRLLPVDARQRLLTALQTGATSEIVVIAALVLAILDVILLAGAMLRFRRARLVLD